MRKIKIIFCLIFAMNFLYAFQVVEMENKSKEQSENVLITEIENDGINSVIYGNNAKRIQANNTIPLIEKYNEIQAYFSTLMPNTILSSSLYTQDSVIYESIPSDIAAAMGNYLEGLGYEAALIRDNIQIDEMSYILFAENKKNLRHALNLILNKNQDADTAEATEKELQNKDKQEAHTIQSFKSTQELISQSSEAQAQNIENNPKDNQNAK